MKGEVREFNFSQQYIFGVFESFCKRLKDLLDMFDNIRTFTQLFSTKLESLLAEEILVNDRIAFEQVKDGQNSKLSFNFVSTPKVVTICKAREYDFLDFRNEKFNTDFIDFNRKVVYIILHTLKV